LMVINLKMAHPVSLPVFKSPTTVAGTSGETKYRRTENLI
jgi:hypothetical protein